MLYSIFAGCLPIVVLECFVKVGSVCKAKLGCNRSYCFVGAGKHIRRPLYCEIERIPGYIHSRIGLHDSVQITAGIAQLINKQFPRDTSIGFFQQLRNLGKNAAFGLGPDCDGARGIYIPLAEQIEHLADVSPEEERIPGTGANQCLRHFIK